MWEKTPFQTLEGAHRTAVKFELNPSSIIDTGQGYRSFQTKTGRSVSIIAQKMGGGPVREKRLPKGKKSDLPLQDPNAPQFGEKDRLLAGPWTDSDHVTLDAVEAYWRKQFVNFDNLEVLDVKLYRVGRDEYEYALDVNTNKLWCRVLSPRSPEVKK